MANTQFSPDEQRKDTKSFSSGSVIDMRLDAPHSTSETNVFLKHFPAGLPEKQLNPRYMNITSSFKNPPRFDSYSTMRNANPKAQRRHMTELVTFLRNLDDEFAIFGDSALYTAPPPTAGTQSASVFLPKERNTLDHDLASIGSWVGEIEGHMDVAFRCKELELHSSSIGTCNYLL